MTDPVKEPPQPQTLGHLKADTGHVATNAPTTSNDTSPKAAPTDHYGDPVGNKCATMTLGALALDRVTGAKPDMDRMASYCAPKP